MRETMILEEIRRVRNAISTKLGHDPRRLVDYYADLQRGLESRLVNYGDDAVVSRSNHASETGQDTKRGE